MKKLLLAFGFIALLLLLPSSTHAQNPDIPEQTRTSEIGFELTPKQEEIDEATPDVTISFPGLEGDDYKVCLHNDFCLKGLGAEQIKSMSPDKLDRYLSFGIDDDLIDEGNFEKTDLTSSNNTIKVCGDGKSKLKTDCQKGRDYFHAGNFYLVTIFQKQGKWFVAGRAGFYVSYHPPKVTVTPLKGSAPETFKVDVVQDASLKDGSKNANNYQIIFEGPGIKEEECLPNKEFGAEFKKKTPGSYSLEFPSKDWKTNGDNFVDGKAPTGLLPGKYLIKINDQTNEGGLSTNDCKGGFTHYHFTCTVTSDPKKPTKCIEVADPNQSDAKKFLALLDALGGGIGGVKLPCNEGLKNVKSPLDCPAIDTAIGRIELSPVGFITRIFSIILSVAGIGALLLIIYSGYRMLISRGNPETIKGARETLTAAVIGLFFIVFSLVILSVITGNVLKIPGFN